MKTLSILGIIISSFWIICSMFMITEPGVWMLFLTFAYFLAQSITSLNKE